MTIAAESVPAPSATEVRPEDLAHLPLLHDVIGTLDDELAGADEIGRAAAALPALTARVAFRFLQRFPSRHASSVGQQIAALGVREFERVLFELLEDLTVLRATLGPQTVMPSADGPINRS